MASFRENIENSQRQGSNKINLLTNMRLSINIENVGRGFHIAAGVQVMKTQLDNRNQTWPILHAVKK